MYVNSGHTGKIFPAEAMTKIKENETSPPTAEISLEIYPSCLSVKSVR